MGIKFRGFDQKSIFVGTYIRGLKKLYTVYLKAVQEQKGSGLVDLHVK